MKVKIFHSNKSSYDLELQVNAWLKTQINIEVVNMSMTCYSKIGEYYMAILYKEV